MTKVIQKRTMKRKSNLNRRCCINRQSTKKMNIQREYEYEQAHVLVYEMGRKWIKGVSARISLSRYT